MENRADKELKQIAIDIYKGHIFTDRQVYNAKDLPLVFMVIPFMDEKDIKKLQDDPPGLMFEYIDKAGPRAINGMPSFFSMQMLSKEDTKKAFDLVDKLKEAEKVL